jgi:hypothetical protein
MIASNLTEQEALLVEATLIWKLGKYHNKHCRRPLRQQI